MSTIPFSDPYQSPQPLPQGYLQPGMQYPPGYKPPVWFWYCAYCLALALLYLGTMLFVPLVQHMDPSAPEEAKWIVPIIVTIVCLPLVALFGVAPFLPRKKFAWYYGF